MANKEMTNILYAIYNILNQDGHAVTDILNEQKNRANSMGEALENYMKDAFANTLALPAGEEKNKIYSQVFSWLGNQNNPPDFIIRAGDAIEVKKIESLNSDLALNSSYPKSSLQANNAMIVDACKTCEQWTAKDIIYAVGTINGGILRSLWMVYGNLYAALPETYERIKTTISNGIRNIPGVEFSETKELGRVNRVDPLGITNLRIRGMWSIQNPRKTFEYIDHRLNNNAFELACVIPLSKYNSFDRTSRQLIESIRKNGFTIADKEVKDPNNPAKLIKVKFIKYSN